MEQITISLCMIVKNEESVIGRCLASVQDIVDEIIIVDTGSTDHTKDIVLRYTDKLYDFRWIDDFAAARNYAFSLATKDYILWLDADDIILEADRQAFLKLKKELDPAVDAVSMHYHLHEDKNGQVTASLRRNRLVKRSKNFKWIGAVHEYLEVGGMIINSDIAITHRKIHHDADRNLRIFEGRKERGERFTPRDLYYYANELKDHSRYKDAISVYQEFLDTKQGWVEDNIGACGNAADCCFALNDWEQYLAYTYKSFRYDIPRAESCCRLGYYHLHMNQLKQAIFWYELATKLDKIEDPWVMVNQACWTWLPHLQLCVCYDRMGNYDLAYKHNEIAASFVPKDPQVLSNRRYFKIRRKNLVYSKQI